jgi:hypothetical protein
MSDTSETPDAAEGRHDRPRFYPVFPPDKNASDVIEWLSRGSWH